MTGRHKSPRKPGVSMTAGLPRLWQRVHKKTGYHRDDIRTITFAVMNEIKMMMEEGVKEVRFQTFGRFRLKVRTPRTAYDFSTGLSYKVPHVHIPEFLFNKEVVSKIKKIPIKEKNG